MSRGNRLPADGMEKQPSPYDSDDIQNRNYLNGGFNLCSEDNVPFDIDTTIQKDARNFFFVKSALELTPQRHEKYYEREKPLPDHVLWTKGLNELLNDPKGVRLFREYLETENCNPEYLEILFACRGLAGKDDKDLGKVIKIIYKKLIKNVTTLKQETKQKIVYKLQHKCGLNFDIFKEIEAEIEDILKKTTYPNFFKSDIYLRYFQQKDVTDSIPLSEGSTASSCPSREEPAEDPAAALSTLHEESELEIEQPSTCGKYTLTKDHLGRRNWFMEKYNLGFNPKNKPSSQNYSFFHNTYAPYLPTSARDSERQSVSSEALSESMLSLPDSCGDYSREYKRPKKIYKKMASHNKDATAQTFIPRTSRQFFEQNNLAETKPKLFAQKLADKLNEEVRKREQYSKLSESLKKCEQGEIQICNPKLGKLPLKLVSETFSDQTFDEDEQSIIDQHCMRVWTDKTPNWTPPIGSPPLGSPPMSKRLTSIHNSQPLMSSQMRHKKDALEYGGPVIQDIHYIHNRHIHHYNADDAIEEGYSESPYDPSLRLTPIRTHEKNNNLIGGSGEMNNWGGMSDSSLIGHQKKMMSKYKQSMPENFNSGNFVPSLDPKRLENELSRVKAYRNNAKVYPREKHGKQSFAPTKPSEPLEEPSRKPRSNQSEDFTIIGYRFSGDSVPYMTKHPGKNITLKQFRSLINKRGDFRFFFKQSSNEFESEGVIKIEITDDNEVLPIWEGKIYAEIQPIE